MRIYICAVLLLASFACGENSSFNGVTAMTGGSNNDADLNPQPGEGDPASEDATQAEGVDGQESPESSVILEDTVITIDPESENPNPEVPETPQPEAEPPVEVPEDVQNLCTTLTKVSMTTALNFPARNGCGFGEGDNLAARNAYLQARTVEEATVNLPANAVVCDAAIDSNSDELHYDDFIFFTLNDTILVGSNDVLIQDFPYENQLYSWNWEEVKGLSIAQFNTDAYCLPGSSCVIPGHDKKGSFQLSLDSANENFAQIAVDLFEKNTATFKLIATGDNDEGDCEHSDFNLDLTIDYVVAP